MGFTQSWRSVCINCTPTHNQLYLSTCKMWWYVINNSYYRISKVKKIKPKKMFSIFTLFNLFRGWTFENPFYVDHYNIKPNCWPNFILIVIIVLAEGKYVNYELVRRVLKIYYTIFYITYYYVYNTYTYNMYFRFWG